VNDRNAELHDGTFLVGICFSIPHTSTWYL